MEIFLAIALGVIMGELILCLSLLTAAVRRLDDIANCLLAQGLWKRGDEG